jgi:DNA-binding IclR family transcriptional regulator
VKKLYGDSRARVAAKFRGSKGVRVTGPTEKKNPFYILATGRVALFNVPLPTLNRQMNSRNRDKSFPTL